MNLKLTMAFTAAFVSTSAVAQDNILDVRENYNIGQTVTVTGVVTSDDNLGSVRYLQDATAGIAIYPGADWTAWADSVVVGMDTLWWDGTPNIGDSLSVTGELTEYSGLLEVGSALDSVHFLGAGTVPTPVEITPAQLGENLEGQLVRINGVTFPLAGTFITGNNTYDFNAAGESGVIYVRTSNSLVGEELTGCEVDMLGIVSQFSFDGFGGYQLLPRGPVDLIPASALCYTSPVSQTNLATTSFTLSWTTDLACDGTVEYGLTEDLGMTASAITPNTPSHFVNLEGLEPGTIYYARAVSTLEDGTSVVSTIRPYATVSESSGDIHVYFNGPVDHSVATEELALSLGTDMNDTVAAWIMSAQHTLDVAAYNLNDQTVEDAVNAAVANGVQVRWIYEGGNANIGLNSLDNAVVTHPRTDGEGSGMHNKFIIGDADYVESAFVLTGSTNLTTGQLVSDLNNAIVLEDQSLARAYELEFEEMWGSEGMTPDAANSKFGADKTWNTPVNFLIGGSEVELYFSPTDGTNAAILAEVESANADLEFALLTLTRDDLGAAIVELNQSFFVSPVGVIEQVNTTGSEFDNLISNGVQVYAHELSGDCHHKYAIVDHSEPGTDPLVITGSHNWSSSAESVNDENTVIVHDARVANLYHQEFRGIVNAINGTGDAVREAGVRTWSLMPNPAREQVWVQGVQATDAVRVLDASGREAVVSQWRQGAVIQLDLNGLSAGMYHVAVTAPNGSTTTARLAVQ
ncbi:MAG: phospholipase D-like domain-containing protein [Bacteroidetes bacterium]|nr:phospholipase D-like domain-containing protein [Bacteroidota bacterium]